MNNEDSRICITSSGGVKKNSDMNKGDGVVEGIMIVEIPREDDEEDEGIEGNPRGWDVHAWRARLREVGKSLWKVT